MIGWTRPILSDSLAVHPDDVQHAVDHAKKMGVPTEFEPKTGRPLIRSHQHQREYCKAYGFADRSSSNRKKKD